MTNTELQDIKIIDMAISTPPRKLGGDAELLATFGILMWPIAASNLRLVRHKGEMNVWVSTRDVRFLSAAKPSIIEAAMKMVRQSIKEMGDLAE